MQKNRSNQPKNGLGFEEASQVFFDPDPGWRATLADFWLSARSAFHHGGHTVREEYSAGSDSDHFSPAR
jgi:hypothetical protein